MARGPLVDPEQLVVDRCESCRLMEALLGAFLDVSLPDEHVSVLTLRVPSDPISHRAKSRHVQIRQRQKPMCAQEKELLISLKSHIYLIYLVNYY